MNKKGMHNLYFSHMVFILKNYIWQQLLYEIRAVSPDVDPQLSFLAGFIVFASTHLIQITKAPGWVFFIKQSIMAAFICFGALMFNDSCRKKKKKHEWICKSTHVPFSGCILVILQRKLFQINTVFFLVTNFMLHCFFYVLSSQQPLSALAAQPQAS